MTIIYGFAWFADTIATHMSLTILRAGIWLIAVAETITANRAIPRTASWFIAFTNAIPAYIGRVFFAISRTCTWFIAFTNIITTNRFWRWATVIRTGVSVFSGIAHPVAANNIYKLAILRAGISVFSFVTYPITTDCFFSFMTATVWCTG
jgi:hypothetical protein